MIIIFIEGSLISAEAEYPRMNILFVPCQTSNHRHTLSLGVNIDELTKSKCSLKHQISWQLWKKLQIVGKNGRELGVARGSGPTILPSNCLFQRYFRGIFSPRTPFWTPSPFCTCPSIYDMIIILILYMDIHDSIWKSIKIVLWWQ